MISFLILGPAIYAQPGEGVINGKVYNSKNNEPVPFANIVIWQTTTGSVSNFDGEFKFTGMEPGYVKLKVSSVGYETFVTESFMVTNAKPVYLEIPLEEKTEQLEEVVIKASTPSEKAFLEVSLLPLITTASLICSSGASSDR